MSLEGGGALEDQLPGRLLLVEGDEAEILGGVVAQLVHGANHFNHRSKLENQFSMNWITIRIDLPERNGHSNPGSKSHPLATCPRRSCPV